MLATGLLPQYHRPPFYFQYLPRNVQRKVMAAMDYGTLINLSCTSRYYHQTVRPLEMASYESKVEFVTHALRHFPQHNLARELSLYRHKNGCYFCFRILTADRFALELFRTCLPGAAIDFARSQRRFCIPCGLRHGFYFAGDVIKTIRGNFLELCQSTDTPSQPPSRSMPPKSNFRYPAPPVANDQLPPLQAPSNHVFPGPAGPHYRTAPYPYQDQQAVAQHQQATVSLPAGEPLRIDRLHDHLAPVQVQSFVSREHGPSGEPVEKIHFLAHVNQTPPGVPTGVIHLENYSHVPSGAQVGQSYPMPHIRKLYLIARLDNGELVNVFDPPSWGIDTDQHPP